MTVENMYLEDTYTVTAQDVDTILGKYADRLTSRQVVTSSDLEQFVSEYNSAKLDIEDGQLWTLSDGVYFCMTLVTTIGIPQTPSKNKNRC